MQWICPGCGQPIIPPDTIEVGLLIYPIIHDHIMQCYRVIKNKDFYENTWCLECGRNFTKFGFKNHRRMFHDNNQYGYLTPRVTDDLNILEQPLIPYVYNINLIIGGVIFPTEPPINEYLLVENFSTHRQPPRPLQCDFCTICPPRFTHDTEKNEHHRKCHAQQAQPNAVPQPSPTSPSAGDISMSPQLPSVDEKESSVFDGLDAWLTSKLRAADEAMLPNSPPSLPAAADSAGSPNADFSPSIFLRSPSPVLDEFDPLAQNIPQRGQSNISMPDLERELSELTVSPPRLPSREIPSASAGGTFDVFDPDDAATRFSRFSAIVKAEVPRETAQQRIERRLLYFCTLCDPINPEHIERQEDCQIIFHELDRKLRICEYYFSADRQIPAINLTVPPRSHAVNPDFKVQRHHEENVEITDGNNPGEFEVHITTEVTVLEYGNMEGMCLAQAQQYFAELRSEQKLVEVIDLTGVQSHSPDFVGTRLPFVNINSIQSLVARLTQPISASTIRHHPDYGYRRGWVVVWYRNQLNNDIVLHTMVYFVDNIHDNNPHEPIVYIFDLQPRHIYISGQTPEQLALLKAYLISQSPWAASNSPFELYCIEELTAHGYKPNPIGIANTIGADERNIEPSEAQDQILVKTENDSKGDDIVMSSEILQQLAQALQQYAPAILKMLSYWQKDQGNTHARRSAQKRALVRSFQQNVLRLRNYSYREVGSDGNCFFHAVAYQLNRLGGQYTHRRLREMAVNEILTNSARYHGFTHDFGTFVTRMTNNGVWANNIIIQALANALAIQITIIRNDGQLDTVIDPVGVVAYTSISIGYLVGLHYVALDPNLPAPLG